jgi:katanin p80 WD40 repeat-containing subunit B1
MKSQKISSIPSHSSTTCLKIGPKSGRVLVTGGKDKLINLYALGKQHSILSLSGHVTSIESCSMDWSELLVVAGSYGGSLKLWDLDNAVVVRTLAGHKGSVSSVEFHPFGEFFASGSVDKSIKVWDVRRKGCIQTYYGHLGEIKELQISPDGRWIASGSIDGIKIWDLTAGKLLTTIGSNPNSIAFNPSEFVLGSATENELLIYDLNTFELISKYKTNADKIVFSLDGNNLLVSSKCKLENLNWEPIEVVQSMENRINSLVDIKVLPDNNGAVGCSINGNFIDVWAFGGFVICY